jgi:hypothetical protein
LALAQIARAILAGKQQIHQVVGSAVGMLTAAIGGRPVARAVATELGSRIPLPWEQKITAAASGTQMIGIALCLSNGDPLVRCPCFVDLALNESKEVVKAMLPASSSTGVRRQPSAVSPGSVLHRPFSCN